MRQLSLLFLCLTLFTLPLGMDFFVLGVRELYGVYTSLFVSFMELCLCGSLLFAVPALFRDGLNITSSFRPVLLAMSMFLMMFAGVMILSLVQNPGLTNVGFSLFLLIRLCLAVGFLCLLWMHRTSLKWLLRSFFAGMVLQVLLAFVHVTLGTSLGLSLLGESQLSLSMSNVAKVHLLGETLLRGYGTFSHPNILAFAFFVAMLLSFLEPKKWLRYVLLCIFLLGIGLTFSKTVLFMVVLLGILRLPFLRKVVSPCQSVSVFQRWAWGVFLCVACFLLFIMGVPILLDMYGSSFVYDRLTGYALTFSAIAQHPLGVGFGGAGQALAETASSYLYPWQLEPPHNIFLYFALEFGILPLGIFLGGLVMLLANYVPLFMKKTPLLAIGLLLVPFAGLFDHYLYDRFAAQLLVILLFMVAYLQLEKV